MDSSDEQSGRKAEPTDQAQASSSATMRAMVHDRYGDFDGLGLRQIARPTPADNEVLVRVHSAGLHVADCFAVRGAPLPVRVETGLFKPSRGIPGFDAAGTVEAVGAKVTRFRPGDAVFGECKGSCSEFVCTTEKQIAPKPEALSFEQAAAVPTSGLAALHALRDAAQLQAGQRVLINGASGGVGSFAVQIARHFGAHVTGVCSTKNVSRVKELGADHVVDYTVADFTTPAEAYDLILDNVENRSLPELRRALMPTGTLILNSGTGAEGLKFMIRLVKPLLLSPFIKQRLCRYLSMPNREDLDVLGSMVDSGKLRPLMDRSYTLEQTADALAYLETGHASGKVTVRVRVDDASA